MLRSAVVELGCEPLMALAAVEQMPAHRRARRRHRAAADRLHDVAVLLLERLAVGAPRHSRPAANSLPRDNEASEVLQKAPKLRIAGRVGDAAMEREILHDRILAALDRA